MIAAQAGVTPSTIYRRWGDINQLFSDVALNELKPDMEPKDLGSFQQDITAWVEQYFEEYASEVRQDLCEMYSIHQTRILMPVNVRL